MRRLLTVSGQFELPALRDLTADTVVQLRFNADQEHSSDPILASLAMPVLPTEIYQGMDYTSPFAETIYLEGFADALRAQYSFSDK